MSDLNNIFDIEEMRLAAEKLMPEHYKSFVNNVGTDETLRGDIAAWAEFRLRPRALVDVSTIDTSVSVLGQRISQPIIAAPFIGSSFLHVDGEVATARATVNADTIMTLSMNGHRGPEPVGEIATGKYWQQIYWVKDRSIVEDVVARAVASGASALCLTVDLPVMPSFPRPMREAFFSLFEYWDRAEHKFYVNSDYSDRPFGSTFPNPAVTWKDLEWLRGLSNLPLLLKGVIREDDAIRARDYGAAGIIVSNHAGQGMRYSQPVAYALPSIVDAVGSDLEVFADSGIRSGFDVIRALALGAKAVLVGRPVIWGLATGGTAGVERAFEILRSELIEAMAITGAPSIGAIDSSILAFPRR
ncbi:MAG: alpha-hydroxy acid oxidase [Micrococcales bacterium]